LSLTAVKRITGTTGFGFGASKTGTTAFGFGASTTITMAFGFGVSATGAGATGVGGATGATGALDVAAAEDADDFRFEIVAVRLSLQPTGIRNSSGNSMRVMA
jgi:hypothetical protein